MDITDTGNDTQLDHWSDEAEAEIDDLVYEIATKKRRITALPVLPFTGTIPESIQGAADHFVKARYYEYIKNTDMAKHHEKKAQSKVDQYVSRLRVDQVYYGRIV